MGEKGHVERRATERSPCRRPGHRTARRTARSAAWTTALAAVLTCFLAGPNALASKSAQGVGRAIGAPLVKPDEVFLYEGWPVSGVIGTKLHHTGYAGFYLPNEAKFVGSSEVSPETGDGRIQGTLEIPPSKTTLLLFGVVPFVLETEVQPTGTLEGTITGNQLLPGDVEMTLPAEFTVKIKGPLRSLGVELTGFECSLVTPISLTVSNQDIALEELHAEEATTAAGWTLTGKGTISGVECQSAGLDSVLNRTLSTLVATNESIDSFTFRNPKHK